MNENDLANKLAEMFDGVEISDEDLEQIAGGKWTELDEFFKYLLNKYGTLNLLTMDQTLTKEEIDKFEELYAKEKGK